MTDDIRDDTAERDLPVADEVIEPDEPRDATPPQYGVGPFSIREVVLAGIWLVSFVLSFVPISGPATVWTLGILWVLTIGVPTVAVFLIVLRRLSPDGIRRVGSLGIDQFASVAFTVAAAFWLQLLWQQIAISAAVGMRAGSWVVWVQLVLMLAGVVFTVFARFLPVFGEDFRYRPEAVAHPSARPLRPVAPRPVTPRPVRTAAAAPAPVAADAEVPAAGEPGAYDVSDTGAYATSDTGAYDVSDTGAYDVAETGAYETVVVEEPSASASQAFWALAPEERDVLDEKGVPLFRIGPTAWALVIEDRGEVFVVRHEDGRIGYLHDVSGITRG